MDFQQTKNCAKYLHRKNMNAKVMFKLIFQLEMEYKCLSGCDDKTRYNRQRIYKTTPQTNQITKVQLENLLKLNSLKMRFSCSFTASLFWVFKLEPFSFLLYALACLNRFFNYSSYHRCITRDQSRGYTQCSLCWCCCSARYYTYSTIQFKQFYISLLLFILCSVRVCEYVCVCLCGICGCQCLWL